MRRGAIAVALILSAAGPATADTKAVLLSGSTVRYLQTPGAVENFGDLLKEGMFYGRLRVNAFRFDWQEASSEREDNWAIGIGGSLVYKSAVYRGWSATAGLYTSQNPIHMADSEVIDLKGGKDTTSRYRVLTGGEWGMTVPALAYVQYRGGPFRIRAGRQIFESLLSGGNDTKMIPNTFEGYSVESKGWLGVDMRGAWLIRQKLRDHTSFHHVLAYGDDPADPYAAYSQNDDSAMHRGLTLKKLRERGIEDRLFILQAERRLTSSTVATVNYTAVFDLVSSATAEGRWRFWLHGYRIAPALRYMRQFDLGGGAIGGANLRVDTRGYRDPDSLEGAMVAARVDLDDEGAWRLRLGFSQIADRADLVAPWRGFPTGGYTRAMGQYNWYAGTRSWMVRIDYDFDGAGLIPGLTTMARFVVQDFDDTKPGVPADSDVLHLDAIERFEALPGLETRVRIAIVEGDPQSGPVPKSDPSYREYRLEFNYLF